MESRFIGNKSYKASRLKELENILNSSGTTIKSFILSREENRLYIETTDKDNEDYDNLIFEVEELTNRQDNTIADIPLNDISNLLGVEGYFVSKIRVYLFGQTMEERNRFNDKNEVDKLRKVLELSPDTVRAIYLNEERTRLFIEGDYEKVVPSTFGESISVMIGLDDDSLLTNKCQNIEIYTEAGESDGFLVWR